MKVKHCKGIGHAKGYDGCGEESSIRKNGLCPKCLYKWSKETTEGQNWYNRNIEFTKKRILSRERKEKIEKDKEWREEHKSVQQLVIEARRVFQKWIRFRDANQPCISCSQIDSAIWDAGHYFKAELYTGLIFDERNCNKQCRKCNTFMGGNESGYRVGLAERYGEDFIASLEEDANRLRSYKFEKQELRDIRAKYVERLNKEGRKII